MKVTIDLPEGYTIDDIRIPKLPKKQKDNRAYSKMYRNKCWQHKEVSNEVFHVVSMGRAADAARDLARTLRVFNRTNGEKWGLAKQVAFENEREVDFAYEIYKELYDVLEKYAKKGIEEKFPC